MATKNFSIIGASLMRIDTNGFKIILFSIFILFPCHVKAFDGINRDIGIDQNFGLRLFDNIALINNGIGLDISSFDVDSKPINYILEKYSKFSSSFMEFLTSHDINSVFMGNFSGFNGGISCKSPASENSDKHSQKSYQSGSNIDIHDYDPINLLYVAVVMFSFLVGMLAGAHIVRFTFKAAANYESQL